MNAKPIYIITAAVLAWGAWMFRYELVQPGTGPHVYRLDRWTGSLAVAGTSFVRRLGYEKTEPTQADRWWESSPLADEQPKK